MNTEQFKFCKNRWIFYIICLFITNIILAQSYTFGPNVRVNDNPPASAFISTFSSGQHLIAARGDTVYVVWRDDRAISRGIYFARSNDGGQNFLPNVQADRTGDGILPSMTVDELGGIHVAWYGQYIYYAKSTNGGQTFTVPIRASDSSLNSQFGYSTIATSRDGQRIYVAHHNNSGPRTKILLARSFDGGMTFIRPETVVNSDTGFDMLNQSIVVFDDTIVLVAWNNGTGAPQGRHIYFSRSTNGGVSFSPQRIISDTIWGIGNYNSSLTVDNEGKVYVLWSKTDSTGIGLGLTFSQDTGKNFSPTRTVPDVVGGQDPSITALSNGRLFLAWRSWNIPLPDDIMFMYSPDQGVTFDFPISPSDGPFSSEEKYPTLAVNDNGKVFVAWTDSRNDTSDYYRDIYFSTATSSAIQEYSYVETHNSIFNIQPNPSNGLPKIEYRVNQPGLVQIEIINLTGRIIKSWSNQNQKSGDYTWIWNGNTLHNGVYFAILKTSNNRLIRKFCIIKIK